MGGHADPRGSEELNIALSQRRADAVSNELAKRGVGAERIRSVGYGESQLKWGDNPDMYTLDRELRSK